MSQLEGLSASALRRRLSAYPRLPLEGPAPTPLQPLPRLSRVVGGPTMWVKRDDAIGPGPGGNKGRKLSYLLADARQRGRQRVVTFGGLQSNHARMTAAACARLGLAAHLIYFERRPAVVTGNQLLCRLYGARMHYVPLGGGNGAMTLEMTNRLVGWLAVLLAGPGAYFIPVGGHGVPGCLGYVAAAVELHEQAAALGLSRATVVTAAGSGGTLAGLWAGLALLDSPLQVLGIDVGRLWKRFPASVARLAGELCALLGRPRTWAAADAPLVEDRFVGPGYGARTAAGVAAIGLAARQEGLLLDPVYTGKALAGVLGLIREGTFTDADHVIFLHTGGWPGLFAYAGAHRPPLWSGPMARPAASSGQPEARRQQGAR